MATTDTLNQRFLFVPIRSIFLSMALHAVFILLFTTHVLQKLPFFKHPPIQTKQIYQNFIQVDVVALPSQLMNEKVDATLPVVDKPKAVSEQKSAPLSQAEAEADKEIMKWQEKRKEEKKKEKEAAEHAKAEKHKKAEEEALKKIQQEANREEALLALANKAGKSGRAKLAGNKISLGTSNTGAIGSVQDRYAAIVKNAIEKYFTVYGWQKNKNLNAVVYLEINPDGHVKVKRLLTASSDPSFNSQVLQAIDAAVPLPVPDDPGVLSGGITISFSP